MEKIYSYQLSSKHKINDSHKEKTYYNPKSIIKKVLTTEI